jgi:VWFA-related protein
MAGRWPSAIAIVACLVLSTSRWGQVHAGPAQQAEPQLPRPEFTTGVTSVEVDVLVTDSEGRPVRGLTAGDFRLLENGQVQEIQHVAFVDLSPSGASLAGDTQAQASAAVAAPASHSRETPTINLPRVFVLMLDDLHTSNTRSPDLRAVARKFVEQHLAREDLAAVVHVSGRPGSGPSLTHDRVPLLAAIDRFLGQKLPSSTLNRIEDYNRVYLFGGGRLTGGADADEQGRAQAARVAFAQIETIARQLAPIRGRKAILWFGEGIDYAVQASTTRTDASAVRDSLRSAAVASTRANVAVYGIDPRGLAGLSQEVFKLSGVAADPSADLDQRALARELRRGQDTLRDLSEQTGGFAIVNTDNFTHGFDGVVEDTSVYYLLTYSPANQKPDGRYRKIKVNVERPGVRVRARQGYVLARPAGGDAGGR